MNYKISDFIISLRNSGIVLLLTITTRTVSDLTEWYPPLAILWCSNFGICTPPPFRESISWIISSFKFWTATVFLHAHLQVVYYKWVKFHKNPISRLGGVALTRYMDGRSDGQGDSYIPPQTLFAGGINIILSTDISYLT